jgi:hypothetical protein
MKKFIRYCSWELKNDYAASAYFTVMLLMYCIIDLICGVKNVDIIIIVEMFLTNYLLSTLNKIFLDEDKEYSAKSFVIRGAVISVISVIIVIAAGRLGGWFDGLPLWAGLTIYLMLILTYLTIWVILKLGKKYDTQKLNEQLANFKKGCN